MIPLVTLLNAYRMRLLQGGLIHHIERKRKKEGMMGLLKRLVDAETFRDTSKKDLESPKRR